MILKRTRRNAIEEVEKLSYLNLSLILVVILMMTMMLILVLNMVVVVMKFPQKAG